MKRLLLATLIVLLFLGLTLAIAFFKIIGLIIVISLVIISLVYGAWIIADIIMEYLDKSK